MFTQIQLNQYAQFVQSETQSKLDELNSIFSKIPMHNRNFQAHYEAETMLTTKLTIWIDIANNRDYFVI